MKPLWVAAFMIVFMGLGPVALRADNFTWTDTGSGFSASGTLSAHPIGGGAFVADSGTGTFNADSLTLFVGLDNGSYQISPSVLFSFDNELFPTLKPTLDTVGLLFIDATTRGELNIWGTGSSVYSTYTEVGGSYVLTDAASTFTLTSSPVPEPSSLLLLGTGLLALVGLGWRRNSQTTSGPVLS